MNYINLSKPHAYLIWKAKQKAIVSVNPLPIAEKLLLIQDDVEAFGEVILSAPSKISLSEFERLEEEHGVRQEERKLKWPEAESFYLYRIKELIPYDEERAIEIRDGQAELLPLPELSENEKEVLRLAERLPKTLILFDEAVTFEDGKAIFCEGLDGTKIAPILGATFDGKSVQEPLPLYQLALVRIPKLRLKKKLEAVMDGEKAEGTKPYAIARNQEGCSGIAVIKKADGKIMGCHGDDMDKAQRQMAALAEEEEKGKAFEEEPLEEDNKEASLNQKLTMIQKAFYDKFMPKPKMSSEENEYKMHPWIKEVYPEYAVIGYNDKLYKVNYSNDVQGNINFEDKAKWVELQVQLVPSGNVGAKGIWEGYEEAVKAKPFSEWIDDYYNLESKGALELTEEDSTKAVWTSAYMGTLPDSSFLYVKPNCGEKDEMGMTKPRSCRMFPYKDKEGVVDLPHLRNAIARAPQADLPDEIKTKIQNRAKKILADESGEKVGKRVKKTMVGEIKAAWETLKKFLDWAEEQDEEEEEMKFLNIKADSAIGIKKVGDEYWYVTWSSNAFIDREEEIFSTKSLEKYVSEAEQKGDRGYFNLWHIGTKENPELTDFAEKKWQGVAGRFLIEAGPFLKDEKGQAALKFFKQYSEGHPQLAPEGWGCSIEYRYLPEERKQGTYHNIWITRTSTLPRLAAANIWTLGGVAMALTNEQKKAAEEIFGEELTAKIVKAAEDKTKELEEAGVAHKSAEETEEKPIEEQKPEVPAEETLMKALGEKLQMDFKPVADLLQAMAEKQETIEARLKAIEEKTSDEAVATAEKTKDESPKYVFSLFERASEAKSTVVAKGDELKKQKPAEAKTDNSGASAFFPSKR